MKKINLILLIVLTATPLTVLANQEMVTPPVFIFTQTRGLGKDVAQLENDVLKQVAPSIPPPQLIDIFANYDSFRQLRAVLLNYSRQIDELSRRLTVRDGRFLNEAIKLNSDVEAMKATATSLKQTLKVSVDQSEQLKKQSADYADLQNRLDITRDRFKRLMEDLYFKDQQIKRLKIQMAQKDRQLAESKGQLQAVKKKFYQTTILP